jgi:hypothetical protein
MKVVGKLPMLRLIETAVTKTLSLAASGIQPNQNVLPI